MPGYTQIKRDPFARRTLVRRTVRTFNFPRCSECGGTNHYGTLYAYYWEDDSLSAVRQPLKGNFCSVGCMRAYHKMEE